MIELKYWLLNTVKSTSSKAAVFQRAWTSLPVWLEIYFLFPILLLITHLLRENSCKLYTYILFLSYALCDYDLLALVTIAICVFCGYISLKHIKTWLIGLTVTVAELLYHFVILLRYYRTLICYSIWSQNKPDLFPGQFSHEPSFSLINLQLFIVFTCRLPIRELKVNMTKKIGKLVFWLLWLWSSILCCEMS